MLISDDGVFIKFRASRRSAEAMREARIFFDFRENNLRLADGKSVLTVRKTTELEPYVCFGSGNTIIDMGAFSYARRDLPIGMKVGRYCSIGPGCTIPTPRHPIEYVSTSPFTYDSKFLATAIALADRNANNFEVKPNPQPRMPIIGNDVWIGENVTIMPGVTIGDGAVVATNATVTKDVLPYSIVMGTPAKQTGMRFNNSIIDGMLSVKWWEYHLADFEGMAIDKPDVFLRELERKIQAKEIDRWNPEKRNISDILISSI